MCLLGGEGSSWLQVFESDTPVKPFLGPVVSDCTCMAVAMLLSTHAGNWQYIVLILFLLPCEMLPSRLSIVIIISHGSNAVVHRPLALWKEGKFDILSGVQVNVTKSGIFMPNMLQI